MRALEPPLAGPPPIAPPRDEAELRARLLRLAGRPVAALAAAHGLAVPDEPRRAKGFVGQLLERALGATAGSRAEPDFPQLGIELKTIPVDARGSPRESCFVSSLDQAGNDRRWEGSSVQRKLARVAWVAVEASPTIPLGARRLGAALIWSPSAEEERALREDYENICELLDEGVRVRGHTGAVLQLRPKGKDGRDLRWGLDEEGGVVRTAPRAFYLRPAFTAALLARHFTLPA